MTSTPSQLGWSRVDRRSQQQQLDKRRTRHTAAVLVSYDEANQTVGKFSGTAALGTPDPGLRDKAGPLAPAGTSAPPPPVDSDAGFPSGTRGPPPLDALSPRPSPSIRTIEPRTAKEALSGQLGPPGDWRTAMSEEVRRTIIKRFDAHIASSQRTDSPRVRESSPRSGCPQQAREIQSPTPLQPSRSRAPDKFSPATAAAATLSLDSPQTCERLTVRAPSGLRAHPCADPEPLSRSRHALPSHMTRSGPCWRIPDGALFQNFVSCPPTDTHSRTLSHARVSGSGGGVTGRRSGGTPPPLLFRSLALSYYSTPETGRASTSTLGLALLSGSGMGQSTARVGKGDERGRGYTQTRIPGSGTKRSSCQAAGAPQPLNHSTSGHR